MAERGDQTGSCQGEYGSPKLRRSDFCRSAEGTRGTAYQWKAYEDESCSPGIRIIRTGSCAATLATLSIWWVPFPQSFPIERYGTMSYCTPLQVASPEMPCALVPVSEKGCSVLQPEQVYELQHSENRKVSTPPWYQADEKCMAYSWGWHSDVLRVKFSSINRL